MEEKMKQIAEQVYQENQGKNQNIDFKVSRHIHNGVDTPRISQTDIISGTYSSLGFKSLASETFTIETFANIESIKLTGIAANGLGQKASLVGYAFIGNCYEYGVPAGNISYYPLANGNYSNIVQASTATYIDTSSLANARVIATGNTINSPDPACIVLVQNQTGATVAKVQVIDWTATTITFQTTLAANWYVTCFLIMN